MANRRKEAGGDPSEGAPSVAPRAAAATSEHRLCRRSSRGAAPFSGDVLVEGQRIVTVERGGLPRGGARIIDGAGATLMPWL
jgi:imidazolonepropionase-like amidohydrolase